VLGVNIRKDTIYNDCLQENSRKERIYRRNKALSIAFPIPS